METSAVEPKPNSSAPRRAAMTTSRPVFKPPSTARRTRERRVPAMRTWATSASPISHGAPAVVTRHEDRVGVGLDDARRDRADAGGGDELDADTGARIDALQVVDQLRQVLDGIDVVMGRGGD